MDGNFGLDLDTVIHHVENAETFSIFFPILRRALVVDLREAPGQGPLIRVMPMARSAADRNSLPETPEAAVAKADGSDSDSVGHVRRKRRLIGRVGTACSEGWSPATRKTRSGQPTLASKTFAAMSATK